MKTLLLFVLVLPMLAQGPVARPALPRTPSIQPTPQPAQTISLKISAELATALEGFRLNAARRSTTDSKGVTTTSPVYESLTELVYAVLAVKGGLFQTAVKQFPSTGQKTLIDDAKAAVMAADTAVSDVIKQPK